MKIESTTEMEMQKEKVPTPHTAEELNEYLESILSLDHNYGTCVYAMSMAATAAFNFMAHKLQVTGFQASCADLDILRRTRHIEGPFILLKGEDMLYPQYNLVHDLEHAMMEWRPWAAEEAKKQLEEHRDGVHPNVVSHWKKLSVFKS